MREVSLAVEGELEWIDLKGPFLPKLFYDSTISNSCYIFTGLYRQTPRIRWSHTSLPCLFIPWWKPWDLQPHVYLTITETQPESPFFSQTTGQTGCCLAFLFFGMASVECSASKYKIQAPSLKIKVILKAFWQPWKLNHLQCRLYIQNFILTDGYVWVEFSYLHTELIEFSLC